MPKQSAGILLYRRAVAGIEVLLAHPGGPFWANKDKGVWSIPKGEFDSGEAPLEAAKREFEEEIGTKVVADNLIDLGTTKTKSDKTIYIWAALGDLDSKTIRSNGFTMKWPPGSDEVQEFPEVDRANWFSLQKATQKLNQSQVIFIERLAEQLGISLAKIEQASLF